MRLGSLRVFQQTHHVLLVGFHTWLTIGIGANKTSFNDCGQHQHLEQLTQSVFVDCRKNQVGCWTAVVRVSLIRAVDGGLPGARHRRVGEGRGLALELAVETARQGDRRGAAVDDGETEPGLGDQAASAVGAEADLLDLLAAGQRQEDRAGR